MEYTRKTKRKRKSCSKIQIRNPYTNRCVKIDGKIGKEIIRKLNISQFETEDQDKIRTFSRQRPQPRLQRSPKNKKKKREQQRKNSRYEKIVDMLNNTDRFIPLLKTETFNQTNRKTYDHIRGHAMWKVIEEVRKGKLRYNRKDILDAYNEIYHEIIDYLVDGLSEEIYGL